MFQCNPYYKSYIMSQCTAVYNIGLLRNLIFVAFSCCLYVVIAYQIKCFTLLIFDYRVFTFHSTFSYLCIFYLSKEKVTLVFEGHPYE